MKKDPWNSAQNRKLFFSIWAGFLKTLPFYSTARAVYAAHASAYVFKVVNFDSLKLVVRRGVVCGLGVVCGFGVGGCCGVLLLEVKFLWWERKTNELSSVWSNIWISFLLILPVKGQVSICKVYVNLTQRWEIFSDRFTVLVDLDLIHWACRVIKNMTRSSSCLQIY